MKLLFVTLGLVLMASSISALTFPDNIMTIIRPILALNVSRLFRPVVTDPFRTYFNRNPQYFNLIADTLRPVGINIPSLATFKWEILENPADYDFINNEIFSPTTIFNDLLDDEYLASIQGLFQDQAYADRLELIVARTGATWSEPLTDDSSIVISALVDTLLADTAFLLGIMSQLVLFISWIGK